LAQTDWGWDVWLGCDCRCRCEDSGKRALERRNHSADNNKAVWGAQCSGYPPDKPRDVDGKSASGGHCTDATGNIKPFDDDFVHAVAFMVLLLHPAFKRPLPRSSNPNCFRQRRLAQVLVDTVTLSFPPSERARSVKASASVMESRGHASGGGVWGRSRSPQQTKTD